MTEVVSVILILTATPFVVYLSAKLGVYGFLRGRALFEKHHNKGAMNGNESEEA